MVEQNDDLNAIFHALADPARRDILASLQGGPKSIGELAAPLDMSFAGASKHISVLEAAELLVRKKEGRSRICSLRARRLALIEDWLNTYASYWSARLDALVDVIEEGK